MSAPEGLIIALSLVTFALLRFGVPLLIMSAIRLVGNRIAPMQG